jgi:hydrogenase maturation protease
MALVLGIGNLLWADEGFGVRAAQRMAETRALPKGVWVVDGGTQGMYLLPLITSVERLLVLDAVDLGLAPGTLVILRGDEIPRAFAGRKLSLHQTSFLDVLAAAELTGGGPRDTVLIGVQAGDMEAFGEGLTPAVEAAMDPALDAALAQLEAWCVRAEAE